MSYRSDISAAIKAQLDGQTIAAAGSIFTSLDRALAPSDFPAIIIYTMTSRRGDESLGESQIPRVVTVAIEAAVISTPASAQADAEDFATEIENAMDADRSLGNLVQECQWQETVTDISAEGEVTMGVVLLQYQVQMATNAKPDSAFEFLEEGMEDAPIPTEIYINAEPTAAAYSNNDFTDDITAIVVEPIAPTAGACEVGNCEDGSCDIEAYQGDQDRWPPVLPDPEPAP